MFKGIFRLALILALLMLTVSAAAQTQKPKARQPSANDFNQANTPQRPLYADYKGVRLGMSAEVTRAKLGTPALKADDQDYYIISPTESAQIAYDVRHNVSGISIDYAGGVGAPDPKTVVGGDVEVRNGSAYKMVRYESLGFWVSYNRTAEPVVVVTVTLQRIIQ